MTAEASALRVVVSGGGTGGHVFPAVTTIRELRGLGVRDIVWVGKAGGLEEKVAASEDVSFRAVAVGKIRRAPSVWKMLSWANITDMCRVPWGIAQAAWVIGRFRPDVVLTTGGYVALPVGLAGWLCRRPVVVHEQTVHLGLTNKVLARVARTVAVSSESTLTMLPQGRRAVVTGNPVRPELFTGQADKALSALSAEGFSQDLPTVYVTGGAQGAVEINEALRAILPWLLQQANVVHQCGPSHLAGLRRATADLPRELAARYVLVDFVREELPDVLALADVVVSRSGAGTIAELTALGKAAVLVPLASSAGGEQRHAARYLQEQGAAVALLDGGTPEALWQALEPLVRSAIPRNGLARQARSHGKPDAAKHLVREILAAAGNSPSTP